MKQISEQLVKRGHDVTVATTKLPNRTDRAINGVKIEEFAISGNAVRGFTGDTGRYQEFLQNGQFDVMMNYAAQQWATDLAFPVLDRLQYAKVLAPCGFSGLFIAQFAEYFTQIPEILRPYNRLLFHSDMYRDTEFARQHGLRHYTVVPNGASDEEFRHIDASFRRRYGIAEDLPLLMTVGSHTGLKGHCLSIEAFRRARLGPSVLLVIGNTLDSKGCLPDCRRRAWRAKIFSLGRKRVMLLDPPRPEVVAAYQAADLFVFGSNVECSPLVLFESMASKTAFITSACGNAEEIVEWSNGGVVVPTFRRPDGSVEADPDEMVQAIEKLIGNSEQRRQLGEAGHSAWQERFTWEKVAGEYERLYQAACDNMGARVER
ncbi:MAG: glycosyltransferase family 4 protein [Chloroflexi bacterium]|nr:glycosyltransferase family 4 protein [Chloroflexota bacterium]